MLNTIFIAFQLKTFTQHKKNTAKFLNHIFSLKIQTKIIMSFCRQGSPKNLKNSVTKFSLTELPILRMPSCRSLFLSLFYPHSTFHPISHFYMPNDVCLTSPSRGHFSFYNPLSTIPTFFYQLYSIERVRRGNSDFLLRYNFETTIKY